MPDRQTLAHQITALNDECVAALTPIIGRLFADAANHRLRATKHSLSVVHRTHHNIERVERLFFVATIGGSSTYISPRLAHWLDSTPENVLGDGWLKFIDGLDEQKRISGIWMMAGQVKQPFTYTARCKTAMGRIVYAFIRVQPVENPNTPDPVMCMGTVHPQVLPARVGATKEQSA